MWGILKTTDQETIATENAVYYSQLLGGGARPGEAGGGPHEKTPMLIPGREREREAGLGWATLINSAGSGHRTVLSCPVPGPGWLGQMEVWPGV